MDSTTDVSSPQYFMTTYHVGEAQAAELSRQAGLVTRTGGGGITAEGPRAATPPSSSPAGTPALSATAAYAQLQADRTAGKVSTDEYRKQERALAEAIANGNGAMPLSPAPAPVNDPFAQHFAPPASPEEYRFPHGATTPTDEQMAADSALKIAMHQEQMPKSMVESIASNLRSATVMLANETPEQAQARLDGNKARMTAMWAKEGITFDQAIRTIDAQLEAWSRNPTLRPYIQNAARFLGPLDFDAILQFARYRGGRR